MFPRHDLDYGNPFLSIIKNAIILHGVDLMSTKRIEAYFGSFYVDIEYINDSHCKLTFKNQEDDHRVDLPVDQRNQAMSNKAGDIVKINIRKSGAFVLMDEAVTEEMLEATMKEAVEKRPEVKVLIRADKESKHLYLANVLSICKFVGVKETHIKVKTLD